jgi:hypothetical protein
MLRKTFAIVSGFIIGVSRPFSYQAAIKQHRKLLLKVESGPTLEAAFFLQGKDKMETRVSISLKISI